MTKFCNKCRTNREISEFRKDVSKKGGMRPECKLCSKKRLGKWGKKNKTKLKGYAKRYAKNDSARFKSGKWGALKRGLAWELTIEEWQQLVVNQKCHYCEDDLSESGCSLDRQNNLIGYVKGNVVPCCKLCNMSKGALTLYEWNAWLKRVTKFIK